MRKKFPSSSPLPRDPPEQVGKRVAPDELERAAAESPRSQTSIDLLRQEGIFAARKLMWLQSKRDRPDILEREASAGATVAVAWPELEKDIEAGHKWRTEQKQWARRPRSDALTTTLTAIIRDHPTASASSILAYLRDMVHLPDSPIESVTDELIEWTDAKGRA